MYIPIRSSGPLLVDETKYPILFIGDSIIKRLNYIYNVRTVSFRGASIEELTQLISGSHVPFLQHKSVVIIHAGTNNIIKDSIGTILSKLDKLLQVFASKICNPHLVLSLCIQRPIDFNVTGPKVFALNKALQAREIPWGMNTIPTYTVFQKNNMVQFHMFNSDGLHPRPYGDMRLRKLFLNEVDKLRKYNNIQKAAHLGPKALVFVRSKKPRKYHNPSNSCTKVNPRCQAVPKASSTITTTNPNRYRSKQVCPRNNDLRYVSHNTFAIK